VARNLLKHHHATSFVSEAVARPLVSRLRVSPSPRLAAAITPIATSTPVPITLSPAQPPPFPASATSATSYLAFDLLSTAILIVDPARRVLYANTAAEHLFGISRKTLCGAQLTRIIDAAATDVFDVLAHVIDRQTGYSESNVAVPLANRQTRYCSLLATPLDARQIVLEFQALDQHIKIAREERLHEQQRTNRELLRHLAHEIKNPLGGIRGAAQLLERELEHDSANAGLTEYTQVIVSEADRLQKLLDRLLTPQRLPKIEAVNVHEVLEYVRNVLLLEFPDGLRIARDYDISLPDLMGDREQLLQAFLNVVRNAAQALQGHGEIRLQTRVARQVTIARERHKLALEIRVSDAGPGVPAHLQESIFSPLVSGREGGVGVGLSIAQNFVQQHAGVIEFDSVPGETHFIVLLPLVPSAPLRATSNTVAATQAAK
jgi:two-component system, NtrC family, nitrogen regulation sensor histidine kinase GlnL